MTHSEDGMFDCKEIDSEITIGNGLTVKATKVGKKRVRAIQKDGSTQNIILEGCKLVPDLAPFNLFSMTYALD